MAWLVVIKMSRCILFHVSSVQKVCFIINSNPFGLLNDAIPWTILGSWHWLPRERSLDKIMLFRRMLPTHFRGDVRKRLQIYIDVFVPRDPSQYLHFHTSIIPGATSQQGIFGTRGFKTWKFNRSSIHLSESQLTPPPSKLLFLDLGVSEIVLNTKCNETSLSPIYNPSFQAFSLPGHRQIGME